LHTGTGVLLFERKTGVRDQFSLILGLIVL
jgi:hypothetical protein